MLMCQFLKEKGCDGLWSKVMQTPHDFENIDGKCLTFLGGEVHAKNDPCKI